MKMVANGCQPAKFKLLESCLHIFDLMRTHISPFSLFFPQQWFSHAYGYLKPLVTKMIPCSGVSQLFGERSS